MDGLINQYIDHTLLKTNTSESQITELCKEADTHGFASVCIPPYYVKLSKMLLKSSEVAIATVVGFPTGYDHIGTKVDSIKKSIDLGADELDVVLNIGAIKSERWQDVESELDSVVTACKMKGKKVKLIIEAALLTETELEKLMPLLVAANPHFVKTSTGYAVPENQIELVNRLRKDLPEHIKIKASGGIRDLVTAKWLIDSGADRLGTSSAIKIVEAQQ